MQTILKTFRLPAECAQFLEKEADKSDISQTEIVVESLKKMMEHQNQWQNDLKSLSEDELYKKEQIDLAEENYE
jgi:predicted transcriptional regulator